MIQKLESATALAGTVRIPGDKSISHRYAMLAAIAEGTSVIGRFAASRDCHSTLACLRALGVEVGTAGDTVTIRGRGLRGLSAPAAALDAGNSGTTMRLLAGILAGQPFDSVLTGDDSLVNRPMGRVLEPLRRMGAAVAARERDLPPLRMRGGALGAIRYRLPVASAQVKSCVLLAGLYGSGTTAVEEPVPTRDHTEIALGEFGAAVRVAGTGRGGPAGSWAAPRLPGTCRGRLLPGRRRHLCPGSDLRLPGVGLNRRRRELLGYLERAGMELEVEQESAEAGEARGDLRVRYSPRLLAGALPPIAGAETAALIDEIPVLAVLGSQAAGGLEISDAGELRVKESDRIAAVAANLAAMGARVTEKPDGLVIAGGARLRGADIATRGDHRIAMAFAVAALAAQGETRIHAADCADVSFPGFWDALRSVR